MVAINVVMGAADWPLDGDTRPDEVARYFADHSTLIGWDVSLALLNIVLMAVFGAGAFATVWPRERDRGEAWSIVGIAGVAIMTALFAAVVATRAALLAGHDPAGGLFDLHNALFGAVGVGLAIILIGFSVGGLRTATIRRWHGILGLIGFVGWLVWLLAFGIVLLRAKDTKDAKDTAGARIRVAATVVE